MNGTHSATFPKVLFFITLLAFGASVQAQQSPADYWETNLKQAYFGDREILDAGDLLSIEAPKRAENPAVVPIRITTGTDQNAEQSIRSITLIVDKNPDPKAGVFNFTQASGQADLDLRIRVDQYSMVRAIAETTDGKLYMTSRFVKGSGGCSAPAAGDLELAMARLGKMQLRTKPATENGLSQLLSTQLKVSHPNITGMQKDQVTHLIMPAHFVKQVNVKLEDEVIFSAELGISISENPTFGFYLSPGAEGGKLTAEVIDNKENIFTKDTDVTVLNKS